MYQYKANQPKRRETDGPFKGQRWEPGRTYMDVPEDKIGPWFEEVIGDECRVSSDEGVPLDPLPSTLDPIEEAIKKNRESEAPGPELDDEN